MLNTVNTFTPFNTSYNHSMTRFNTNENHKRTISQASNVLQLNDDIIGLIYAYMNFTEDKNKFSLVCKQWVGISNEQTNAITLLKPWKECSAKMTDSALIILSNRFKNLTSLDLSFNNCFTGLGITKFTKLTHLNLCENELITDSKISLLTNLTHLNLSCNKLITDSGISNLTNLTHLDLCDNTKISSSGISNLTNLMLLSLRSDNKPGNHLIKDSDIAKFSNLTDLDLSGNQSITNSGIERLTNLLHLDCHCDGITETGIANLTKLISLKSKFTITNEVIINFTNLRNLTLKPQDLVTDAGIKALTGLNSLTITNKIITDEGLSHLTNLTKLNFYDIALTNFTWFGIRNLKNLQNFNFFKVKLGNEFINNCRTMSLAFHRNGQFMKAVKILEMAFEDFPSSMTTIDRFNLNLSRKKVIWKI